MSAHHARTAPLASPRTASCATNKPSRAGIIAYQHSPACLTCRRGACLTRRGRVCRRLTRRGRARSLCTAPTRTSPARAPPLPPARQGGCAPGGTAPRRRARRAAAPPAWLQSSYAHGGHTAVMDFVLSAAGIASDASLNPAETRSGASSKRSLDKNHQAGQQAAVGSCKSW